MNDRNRKKPSFFLLLFLLCLMSIIACFHFVFNSMKRERERKCVSLSIIIVDLIFRLNIKTNDLFIKLNILFLLTIVFQLNYSFSCQPAHHHSHHHHISFRTNSDRCRSTNPFFFHNEFFFCLKLKKFPRRKFSFCFCF